MISISKKNNALLVAAFIFALFNVSLNFIYAEESVGQTLSVSPTLFEMKASPSQEWESEVRVVNVNDYDLLVYPQVVNFAPLDESGRGSLIPVFSEETQGRTLAEWVNVPKDPVLVPRQQTVTIPIKVKVPQDAAPGGHYAAVLIGTRPPENEDKLSQVQTAQFVTSLLFVRIAGDIVESGSIREFTTKKLISQKPEIDLSLRFENDGNVHLQPQGDIVIYNMWGSERGVIPINHQTHFGNVLPQSIREFVFSWKGETSIYDMGRYKAVATLGYGDETKQFDTSTTYFWVIPYVTLLFTLLGLVAFGVLVMWLVRKYIERMLALSGVAPHQQPYIPHHVRANKVDEGTVIVGRYANISRPVKVGVSDLKTKLKATETIKAKARALYEFVLTYKLFFFGCLVVLAFIVVVIVIVKAVAKTETNYEITIGNPDSAVSLTAEDIAYNALRQTVPLPENTLNNTAVEVINVSGRTGAAANTRFILENAGYTVSQMESDEQRSDAKTVVVYDKQKQEEALAISKVLDGALLSASDEVDMLGKIVIYAGSDSLPTANQ